ncbi:AaceriAFR462Cp [[Ashbya] aceris (nom. inval.)]|nr:AaceriAFR462Cp [[Ashbya] aceris (nom. inval.)]
MSIVSMRLLALIAGWYVCSISLSLYNKWMFDPHRGLKIPYPILITSLHQLLLWALAYLYLRVRRQLQPEQALGWRVYAYAVVPTAVACAGDIGFGNLSLQFVSLSVYTIIKSSSIAFVLVFGCLLQLERFHPKLAVVVVVMFFGVVLMAYRPDRAERGNSDETLGCLFVVLSSAMSGARWGFTQLLLRQPAGAVAKRNPVRTVLQLAPPVAVLLFPIAVLIEKPFPAIADTSLLSWEGHSTLQALARGTLLLLFPGVAVFLMTICEFAILQAAPVLTLSIAGVVKELLTILVSLLIFKDSLTLYNCIGMTVVLVDVCYYNYYRYTHPHADAKTYLPLENDPNVVWELSQIPPGDPAYQHTDVQPSVVK